MRKWVGIVPVALALWAIPAMRAVAAAASVQPPPAYPAPQCTKPDDRLLKKIRKPEYSNMGGRADSGNVGSYNALAKIFNQGVVSYNSCISNYIDAANAEIDRLHDAAVAHSKQVADDANVRIQWIQGNIELLVNQANGNGSVPAASEANSSQYPPPDCKKPIEITGRRRTIALTTQYDRDDRIYRACVAGYIAGATDEMQQIGNNARGGTRQIAQDANTQIGLIKQRIRDAIAEANQTAGADSALAALSSGDLILAAMPPAEAGTESVVVTGERIKRSADTPTGEGDPDAIACRMPQQLPDSRIPGPEICKRNREWASLHKAGNDISSDGRSVVPSEKSRTTNRAGLNCVKVTTGGPYTGYITNEYCN